MLLLFCYYIIKNLVPYGVHKRKIKSTNDEKGLKSKKNIKLCVYHVLFNFFFQLGPFSLSSATFSGVPILLVGDLAQVPLIIRKVERN